MTGARAKKRRRAVTFVMGEEKVSCKIWILKRSSDSQLYDP
jgi:hypothetical protein